MPDRFPDPFPPPFAGAWGDDAHGLWAEFELRSEWEAGGVVQRLRWIEPGTFLMGSPADEPERRDDEGPRHTVTLTRGFWMAERACTQTLWRAVMGTNPSRFTSDEERPVERVPRDYVQGFLRELEALLPGCIAGLPTEAGNTPAGRAATRLSASVRKSPRKRSTTTVATRMPVARRVCTAKRRCRRRACRPTTGACTRCTATSGSGAPMACASTETRRSATRWAPPVGPEAFRAVRGGSWLVNAWRARSAYRLALHPGGANDFLGFRPCLRSIEPGQTPGRPGGPAGLAPGGRRAT